MGPHQIMAIVGGLSAWPFTGIAFWSATFGLTFAFRGIWESLVVLLWDGALRFGLLVAPWLPRHLHVGGLSEDGMSFRLSPPSIRLEVVQWREEDFVKEKHAPVLGNTCLNSLRNALLTSRNEFITGCLSKQSWRGLSLCHFISIHFIVGIFSTWTQIPCVLVPNRVWVRSLRFATGMRRAEGTSSFWGHHLGIAQKATEVAGGQPWGRVRWYGFNECSKGHAVLHTVELLRGFATSK